MGDALSSVTPVREITLVLGAILASFVIPYLTPLIAGGLGYWGGKLYVSSRSPHRRSGIILMLGASLVLLYSLLFYTGIPRSYHFEQVG